MLTKLKKLFDQYKIEGLKEASYDAQECLSEVKKKKHNGISLKETRPYFNLPNYKIVHDNSYGKHMLTPSLPQPDSNFKQTKNSTPPSISPKPTLSLSKIPHRDLQV